MITKCETSLLKNHIDIISGISFKPEELIDETKIGKDVTAILRANNIKDDKLNFDDLIYINDNKIKENQYILKNDIIVCASSGSKHLVGKAAIAKENLKMSVGAFCKIIRPKNNINSNYLGRFFLSDYYRRKISNSSSGVNINNIKNEHIENIEIPLPPLHIQEKIAAILDKASSIIDKRKNQIQELNELSQCIFIKMFGDPVKNPMGWNKNRLGEYINFITSGSRGWAKYYSNKGEFFITIKNVKSGKLSKENIQYVNAPCDKEAERTKVREDDLLISIRQSEKINEPKIKKYIK